LSDVEFAIRGGGENATAALAIGCMLSCALIRLEANKAFRVGFYTPAYGPVVIIELKVWVEEKVAPVVAC
jgi:hypothetical protein